MTEKSNRQNVHPRMFSVTDEAGNHIPTAIKIEGQIPKKVAIAESGISSAKFYRCMEVAVSTLRIKPRRMSRMMSHSLLMKIIKVSELREQGYGYRDIQSLITRKKLEL